MNTTEPDEFQLTMGLDLPCSTLVIHHNEHFRNHHSP